MSRTVCILSRTLDAPTAGGHTWVYLNWALGLQMLGCRIIWLETVSPTASTTQTEARVHALRERLASAGLREEIALCARDGTMFPAPQRWATLDVDAAADADLLLDMAYAPAGLVGRFRRTALLDIDPGLSQLWISRGQIDLPRHDFYFTIGETVGRADATFPDCGVEWRHLHPCVFLERWPVKGAHDGAPFTTVSNWIMNDYWVDDDNGGYANDKRAGFLPFLDLPQIVNVPLELALSLGGATDEQRALERRGWQVREAHEIAASPNDYQRYIQGSAGEFSCAKPSCVRLQNAWVSDRTLCYLASGKPAVVQHTGASRFLPDAAGLFRFSTPQEAAQHLRTVVNDYGRQCALARSLAEEQFDAQRIVSRLLEQTMD